VDWARTRGTGTGQSTVPIKVVFADVGGDGRSEKCGGVAAIVQGGTDFAGGGIVGEVGQEAEARFPLSVTAEAECENAGLFRFGVGGIAGGDGDAGRQGGGEAAEVEAGTGGNDEVAGEEEVGGAMPVADAQEGIGAHEAKDLVAGVEFGAQGVNGVDGVVGTAVGTGGIEERDFHVGLLLDGEAGHGDTIVEIRAGGSAQARRGCRRAGAVALEGLHANGGDEQAIEAEALDSEAAKGDMAAMGRIEASTKKADVHWL
jgi:hypothetical protein